MSTKTVNVLPQPFYQGEIYADDVDYTVVENAELSEGLGDAVERATQTVRRCFAAVAVSAFLTIPPAGFLPSASTATHGLHLAESEGPSRRESLRALTDRLHSRAAIVSSAFTRVPLSAAERTEDPDHGF
jgi:hypothetical protein